MSVELDLFGEPFNVWEKEWKGMPEYSNVVLPPPQVEATFKFRTEEDFLEFNKHIQKHLYDGVRPFDGMQKKDVKSTWYPLNEKGSKYVWA